MRRLSGVLVAVTVGGALGAAGGAAPALAAETKACASGARAEFARVQLYRDADCKGPSVIVGKSGDGNRPNFASFKNFDGSTRSVDNSRSSLAIDAGSCVRFFDGVSYGGLASTNICAGARPIFWNLDRFDDRGTSMRTCLASAQAACNAPAAAPAPKPAPAPAPAPQPAPAFNPDPKGFGGSTTAAKKKNYYAKVLPLARATNREFGVPVSFTMAQGAVESAYGTKDFGYKNFFGIKCVNGGVGPARIAIGCTRAGTTEVEGGRRIKTKANFRIYRVLLDSFRDQGSLLFRTYPRAMAVKNDPNAFARALVTGERRYATDPKYAETIISVMRVNKLYQYDR